MVFQNFSLFENKTAIQNIMLPLIKAKKHSRSDAERIAMEHLKQVGLSEWKDYYPSQLSGGQQQRTAIGRAMIKNPDILLCDEPTGALDSETSVQIMEALKEIAQDFTVAFYVIGDQDLLPFADKRHGFGIRFAFRLTVFR